MSASIFRRYDRPRCRRLWVEKNARKSAVKYFAFVLFAAVRVDRAKSDSSWLIGSGPIASDERVASEPLLEVEEADDETMICERGRPANVHVFDRSVTERAWKAVHDFFTFRFAAWRLAEATTICEPGADTPGPSGLPVVGDSHRVAVVVDERRSSATGACSAFGGRLAVKRQVGVIAVGASRWARTADEQIASCDQVAVSERKSRRWQG